MLLRGRTDRKVAGRLNRHDRDRNRDLSLSLSLMNKSALSQAALGKPRGRWNDNWKLNRNHVSSCCRPFLSMRIACRAAYQCGHPFSPPCFFLFPSPPFLSGISRFSVVAARSATRANALLVYAQVSGLRLELVARANSPS